MDTFIYVQFLDATEANTVPLRGPIIFVYG